MWAIALISNGNPCGFLRGKYKDSTYVTHFTEENAARKAAKESELDTTRLWEIQTTFDLLDFLAGAAKAGEFHIGFRSGTETTVYSIDEVVVAIKAGD
jgi:hypothetical protein